MRATLMGLLIGAGVTFGVLGAWPEPQRAHAQRSRGLEGAELGQGKIIAVPGAVVDGQQVLIVIDSEQRSLASYQVDGRTAQVTLKCVRNFRWDLQLDDYSGTEPSPEKIRALLQPR